MPADYEYALPFPGRIQVREAELILEVREVRQARADWRYDPQQVLEASVARRGLVVRNWRAGDRFWPAHSKQPKKIKELLADRQLAGEEKKRWTVVASGEEIVWMRGFGVRRDYQAAGVEGAWIREFPLDSRENQLEASLDGF